MKHFTLLFPEEFLEHFQRESAAAKSRVWAQVMFMMPGSRTKLIEDAMVRSAARGIDTRLHVDAFSNMVTSETLFGSVWTKLLLSSYESDKQFGIKSGKTTTMFNRIQKSGVMVVKTNTPSLLERILPVIGRDHRKITIIDDVAYIGGMNFTDEELEMPDFMVCVTKPEIVAVLAREFMRVNEQASIEDSIEQCDSENSILVDSGKRGRSLILQTATTHIKQAKKKVRAICYILPDGKLVDSLHSSYKRGVDVEMITSDPAKVKGLFFLLNKKNEFLMRDKTIPTLFHPVWIHAKMLIVDDAVFVGSHNFLESGVRARTKEIALMSKDKDLLSQALEYYASLRRECKPNHASTTV